VIINDCRAKPEIDYPCSWLFKVIGCGCREVEQAIAEVVGEVPFKITASHVSSGGKYHSVDLELEVASEEHRNAIYQNLSAHAAVKVVL
jgi:putative lipoic acid-binding regulatory protein